MKPGDRVDVLVGVNGSAAWISGRITRPVVQPAGERTGARYDVQTDDGRTFLACHIDSLRAIVSEAQS